MIKRELLIFLIVGSLTVLVDFLTYRGLMAIFATPTATAKGIGFVTGTIFAYFANRFWTFGHRTHARSSIARFALLYAVTLGINIGVNATSLSLLDNMPHKLQLAFLLATGVSAVLNFLGMKFFVFAHREAA